MQKPCWKNHCVFRTCFPYLKNYQFPKHIHVTYVIIRNISFNLQSNSRNFDHKSSKVHNELHKPVCKQRIWLASFTSGHRIDTGRTRSVTQTIFCPKFYECWRENTPSFDAILECKRKFFIGKHRYKVHGMPCALQDGVIARKNISDVFPKPKHIGVSLLVWYLFCVQGPITDFVYKLACDLWIPIWTSEFCNGLANFATKFATFVVKVSWNWLYGKIRPQTLRKTF
jgi:hypothetical protein